ncbi:hypothetical protein C8R44DRAFT_893010 [Mycena epipterygia]|nr:hypothetical protein C8R44DRAFT_893010 [Mycena epipterygia]
MTTTFVMAKTKELRLQAGYHYRQVTIASTRVPEPGVRRPPSSRVPFCFSWPVIVGPGTRVGAASFDGEECNNAVSTIGPLAADCFLHSPASWRTFHNHQLGVDMAVLHCVVTCVPVLVSWLVVESGTITAMASAERRCGDPLRTAALAHLPLRTCSLGPQDASRFLGVGSQPSCTLVVGPPGLVPSG